MAELLDKLNADHERLAAVLAVLESELDRWKAGEERDRAVFDACLSYCANYCDLCHHPREDLLFERMLVRGREFTEESVGDLIETHRALTDFTRLTQRRISDALREPGSCPTDVAELASTFLAEYRNHMRWENESFFPAAERILTASDWRELAGRIEDQDDPIFGPAVTSDYNRLYARIMDPEGPAEAGKLGAQAKPTDADPIVVETTALRFGDLMREVTVHEQTVSYNYLTPQILRDESGQEIPYVSPPLTLRSIDIWRLLAPYVGIRIADQLRAVAPLALYLALFQVLILRQVVDNSLSITVGLGAVIIGLMLFIEGLKLGLMPFAEVIGDSLPKKSPLWLVLAVAFVLGIGVTFAEPAIGALQAAGSLVDVQQAPYLYALLNDWPDVVVLVVGIGVGLAAVLGTVRFLYGWSLKPYIYAALAPTLTLTVILALNPDLAPILGLAWDCGAVTTGPVTVPLVLSLGIGIASSAGKGDSSLSGFGIVTLASLFPIIAVMLLGLYVAQVTTPEAIIAAAQSASDVAADPKWYEQTPALEIIGGMRAIIPLVLFLFLIFKVLLKATLQEAGIVLYGLVLCVLGMCVFNVGLTYGLSALGSQSGSLIPAAFQTIDLVPESPLYILQIGIPIAVLFAWILGFGATLAEPALNALGITVENLTNGAFPKRTLMYAVATGVAFGIAIGVLKIVYGLPIAYLLVPAYLLSVVLTYLSTEEFVNVAWDSAGVTTGPVTVPLVLAMGLGLGDAVTAVEGFGILSMASICPILSVLTVGIWVRRAARRRAVAVAAEIETT